MNIRSIFALLLLALVPSVTQAAQPDIANLRGQVLALTDMVNELKKELAATRAELSLLKKNSVLELDGRLGLRQDANGFDTALFNGVNVQIVNGDGATNFANSRGNLIIGYNADSAASLNRIGSHNLVLGDEQSYPATAEVVTQNILSSQDLAINVSGNMNTLVGANQVATIGANQTTKVGKDKTDSIGGSRSAVVGASSTETIGKNSSIAIGDSAAIDVGKDMNIATGKAVAFNAGDDVSISSAGHLAFDGAEELTVTSGKASGIFRKDGNIAIDGKDISIKGSGSIAIRASGPLILKGSQILEN